jgi:hypothetical protein
VRFSQLREVRVTTVHPLLGPVLFPADTQLALQRLEASTLRMIKVGPEIPAQRRIGGKAMYIVRESFDTWRFLGMNHPHLPPVRDHPRIDDVALALTPPDRRRASPSESTSPRAQPP